MRTPSRVVPRRFLAGPVSTTVAILPGDYLDVFDSNAKSLSLITSVSATQLQLASAPSANLSYPRTYRILRGPRPMIGEKQIDLPKDVFVDVSKSVILADQSTGQLDILISPIGCRLTRTNLSLPARSSSGSSRRQRDQRTSASNISWCSTPKQGSWRLTPWTLPSAAIPTATPRVAVDRGCDRPPVHD